MEYQLVSVINDKEEFSKEVTRLISENWELYGNPFCTTWINGFGVCTEYCQAMTKRL